MPPKSLSNSKEVARVTFHKGVCSWSKSHSRIYSASTLSVKTTRPSQILVAPPLSMHMGGISLNTDTGEWICPRCYLVVEQDADNDDQMFDDDEDDGEAFEEVTQFVAEGADKLFVTSSLKMSNKIARLTRIDQAIFKLGNINNKFATYLENNQYYIVKRT